jgi:hypothetical protein
MLTDEISAWLSLTLVQRLHWASAFHVETISGLGSTYIKDG